MQPVLNIGNGPCSNLNSEMFNGLFYYVLIVGAVSAAPVENIPHAKPGEKQFIWC